MLIRTAANADLDILVPERSSSPSYPLEQPRLYADRTFTGYGQEHGGVHTVLQNPSPDVSITLVYLESLPWFMKPYVHTLHATITPVDPASASQYGIRDMYYRPALDRARSTQLELLLAIPPSSVLTLTYEFEKAILRYTEYPPDANRGFDIPPAIIRLFPANNETTSPSSYMRTTSLLLPLPTPDFIIALGFGSVFNLMVRRFVGADEHVGVGGGVLRDRISWIVQAIRARTMDRGKKNV
ncbi:Subunit of the glycosylphosphatidylinositol transamidase complex-like protein [Elasticomyces elasticus]|nr:Subunit of the glycosylphosphatidylinositol transamidase complex-like protein [Elasticomyces elasticus]KAK4994071.1 Subunit of the glycosylphosphatidylinositol transamidase complex-like protein [Elasticomyces elasticus]